MFSSLKILDSGFRRNDKSGLVQLFISGLALRPFPDEHTYPSLLRGVNVKYEHVYLKGYATPPELLVGLTEYFVFYNMERTHQSLGYRTPDEIYRTTSGGGAKIEDKYTAPVKLQSEIKKIKNRGGAFAACEEPLLISMHYCLD